MWPVDKPVGNVRNNDPALTERVAWWTLEEMAASKSAVLSVTFLLGAVITANGDPQYPVPAEPQHSVLPPANPPPARRVPPPASWYYNPYTNGSTTCPEGGPGARPQMQCFDPSLLPDPLVPRTPQASVRLRATPRHRH